eukprot:1369484-Amphidinium_carterae.1
MMDCCAIVQTQAVLGSFGSLLNEHFGADSVVSLTCGSISNLIAYALWQSLTAWRWQRSEQ